MMALVWLLVVVAAGFGLGRKLLRAGSIATADAIEEFAWSVPLGLGLFGMMLFGLGLVGFLHRGLILVLTVLAVIAALPEIDRWLARLRSERACFDRAVSKGAMPCGLVDRAAACFVPLCLVLSGVAVVAALLGALAPPTAGDALCYHLELPKVYLAQHKISYLPDSANSTYPLLMEMFFLWGLALEGGVLAQLFHWLVGLLLAAATYCLAVPLAGRRVARLAAALVLLVPGVTNQMTAPLNDLGAALYVTLTLAAFLRAVGLARSESGTGRVDQNAWIVLAGVYFGLALGMKYVALLVLPALATVWIVERLRKRREDKAREAASSDFATVRGALRTAGMLGLVSLVVGGGWYLRSAIHTGNPVHPFLASWFGGPPTGARKVDKTPLAHTPAGLLVSPWQLTMHPERFGGRAAQLGVLFLALLPGLVWYRPEKALATTLLIALIYYIMWFLLRQNVRFLLPMVPVFAAGGGWVLMRGLLSGPVSKGGMPRMLRGGALGALTLVLTFNTLVAVARARGTAAVALGMQSPEAFLRQTEPSYAAAQYARRALSGDAVILSQDYRGFYFKQRVVRENVFRARTRYDRVVEPGRNTVTWLRQSGFTHALVLEATGPSGIRFDTTLNRLLDPCLAQLPCKYRHEFVDSDGAVRRYRLLELELPPACAGREPVYTAAGNSRQAG